MRLLRKPITGIVGCCARAASGHAAAAERLVQQTDIAYSGFHFVPQAWRFS
jgi:hypothetical protein